MMFYKETNFKETPIGKIPKEWEVVKVGSDKIAEIRGNKIISDIQKVAFIPMELVPDQGIFVKYELRDLKDVSSSTYCKAGDLLLAKITPSLENGKQGIVPEDIPNGFALATTEVYPIVCKGIDRLFLFYVLKFPRFRKILEFSMRGTTGRQRVPKDAVEKLKIPLPSLQEQRKIAEILSTVDEAIQKTNEIIAKTERLKKGLMQELLTSGIGHKEFKDTAIGRIPKEWEVRKLKDVIFEAKSGFACGKRDENGILQLRMDSIEPEGWINTEAGVKVPIPEDVENYFLRPGDILFNNTNSVDLIGKTAIFRGEFQKCVYSNHLTRIRVNLAKAIPEWILYLLIRKWQLGFFKTICHRHVHQAGINNEDIINLKIPVPSISEQKRITLILSSIDEKLRLERNEKVKLERIKQGLMDLLLTGKVRVKVN